MKKLYTFAIAISAAMAVNAQSVGTDVSELPSSTTAQLGEFSQTGLKAQPGELPAIQAPLTFDAYYNRKTNWDVPIITAGTSTFFATYSFGAPGQIGVHFDNSASVQIDRLLVNFFLKSTTSTGQSFNAFIYPAGADSLPNGSATGTKGFGYHDVYAPTSGFDSTHYTTISFASPVTVTADFVAAVQIDNATSGTRARIGIGMNDCIPGNGNNEKRGCVYPVPSAAGTGGPMAQKWYKFNDFYNQLFGTTVFSQWNCDPLIIPLVVGETTPLGTDEVLGQTNGLTFNGHYPSPAVESIKINYATEDYNNVVNLRVFDITGRTIFETNNVEEVAGKHSFDVNVSTFAAGEYFYTIKTDKARINSHFVVTK